MKKKLKMDKRNKRRRQLYKEKKLAKERKFLYELEARDWGRDSKPNNLWCELDYN